MVVEVDDHGTGGVGRAPLCNSGIAWAMAADCRLPDAGSVVAVRAAKEEEEDDDDDNEGEDNDDEDKPEKEEDNDDAADLEVEGRDGRDGLSVLRFAVGRNRLIENASSSKSASS